MSAVPSSPRRGSRTASESSASESSASESSLPRCDTAALIDARLDDSDASRPRRASVSRAAQPRRANGQTPQATGGVGCAVAGEAQPVDGGAGLVRVQAEPERRQAVLHGPGKRLQQMPAELQRRRMRREESGARRPRVKRRRNAEQKPRTGSSRRAAGRAGLPGPGAGRPGSAARSLRRGSSTARAPPAAPSPRPVTPPHALRPAALGRASRASSTAPAQYEQLAAARPLAGHAREGFVSAARRRGRVEARRRAPEGRAAARL